MHAFDVVASARDRRAQGKEEIAGTFVWFRAESEQNDPEPWPNFRAKYVNYWDPRCLWTKRIQRFQENQAYVVHFIAKKKKMRWAKAKLKAH